ncbi:hypothetical protein D9M72_356890 [compost metagenome]
MLGQPAFIAAHGRGNAQREALLAQQRVAAVARAERPDLARFREMDDVLGRVARPGHVLLAGGQRLAHGVHARHELAIGAQDVVHRAAHARHDAHIDRHVRRIGQFHANMGDRRAQRAHRERHHVQRAAAHAALEQAVQRLAHLGGFGPVVGGAGVFLLFGADKGAIFHPRHVRRVRQCQEGILALGRVQPLHGAGGDHLLAQAVILFLRAVAPIDMVGLGQGGDFSDPGHQPGVLDPGRRIDGRRTLHRGVVHTADSRFVKGRKGRNPCKAWPAGRWGRHAPGVMVALGSTHPVTTPRRPRLCKRSRRSLRLRYSCASRAQGWLHVLAGLCPCAIA